MSDQLIPVDFSNLFAPGENVAAEVSFELLPDGWYTAQIIESGARESKAGNRSLSITLEIMAHEDGNPDGVKGRRVFTNLNLWHERADVVERAKRDLKAIAFACNLTTFRASSDFHGTPLQVKIGKSKVSEAYPEPKNEIKGWRKLPAVEPSVFGVTTGGAATPVAPAWNPAAQTAPAWTPPAAPVAPPQAAPVPAPASVWQPPPVWTPPAAPVAPPQAAPVAETTLLRGAEVAPEPAQTAPVAAAPVVAAPVAPLSSAASADVPPWMR